MIAASIFIGITGTLSVSHGNYVISEPITDYGTIEVARDSLEVAGSIFPATGVFQIDAGATLQLDGADSLNVIFTDSTGELILKDPADFTGNIVGLSGSDTIDLTNLSFGTNTKVTSVTYSKTTNITTLTVTDGTTVDTIQLVGDYTGSTWKLSSDGSGGTLLTDPAATSDSTLIAHTDATSSATVGDGDAASSGSLIDASLGSVMPFESALALELNTMLAGNQLGPIPLQQLIEDLTNGQNPLANAGELQTRIIDLTNGHNPVADSTVIVGTPLGMLLPVQANAIGVANARFPAQVVDLTNGHNPVADSTALAGTPLGSGGMPPPGLAMASDAAVIAIAEAAPSGSLLGTALANVQAIGLNATPVASPEVLSELQQVAQASTGAPNISASNGPLPAQVANLANTQNPAADPTNIVDVHLPIAHHDFLIHV